MQCPSCNTELPKKAKICPKCGTAVGKPKGNIKLMAIIGLIIMLIASLLPLVQSGEKIKEGVYPTAYAFSYMNISMPVLWYLFIACIVVGIILIVARKEFFSIITTVIAAVLTVVSVFAVQFTLVNGKVAGGGLKYVNVNLPDILSNGYNGNSYHIGCGFVVLAIGIVIAVAGCFIDIVKPFKKDLHVDAKYLSNSLNQSLTNKMYYYRGFYLMFVPVFVMIMLFNYWPMLGVRYSFTKYVIANPYYIGLYHFQTMFTNDIYFWQAFRNTLILSLIKLFLNTGAAVIISLLLNEITNMIFKKTVQTIIYLPHFMSWVVVASVFKMLLAPYDSAPVNSILINMGVIDTAVDFMNSTAYWRGTFYIMNVWKDTGWGTILFLATLSGISPDLYEAAQFGLIPEFVGRVPVVVALDSLDEESLVRILREPKNAILKQYKALLSLDEVDLEFDDDAVKAIAHKSFERKTGARGLRSILEAVMNEVMYEVPSDETIARCTITKDAVMGTGKPVIEYRTDEVKKAQ